MIFARPSGASTWPKSKPRTVTVFRGNRSMDAELSADQAALVAALHEQQGGTAVWHGL